MPEDETAPTEELETDEASAEAAEGQETPAVSAGETHAAAADSHGHGEEIHMPPNSFWPAVTSVGLAVTLIGVIALSSLPFLVVVGLVILLVGVGAWVWDARREYQELH